MDVVDTGGRLAGKTRGVEMVDLARLLVQEVEAVEPHDQTIVESVTQARREPG